ncbi:MAG: O-antigen ligase family protein, partial [Candidatus Doudnabacteria bacterium]|nr:O-antigen ligase family protein [Candidatus Doudnabacteria bacterium]
MKLGAQINYWLNWLDEHLLILLAGFLLAFIPLYPKIPLFEAIPGYIVRVRLEDILILLTALIWLVQVVRNKVAWKTPVLAVIVAYGVVGLLSSISAVVVTQTVPANLLHIGKTFLHYFRYLEYFSLFAILYSAISQRSHIKVLAAILVGTVLTISVYGYGQRYFYWPVYSTMNREFSKGVRLYLTEHARVQSTFGGHYDLAAYLVVTLPFIFAFALATSKKWLKVVLQLVHWAGVWLLIVSGSRTSFVGYIVAVSLVIGLFALTKRPFKNMLLWGISRLAFVAVVTSFMLVQFGEDMYERFLQVLEGYPQAYEAFQDFDEQRIILVNDTIPGALGLKDLSLLRAEKPDGALSMDEAALLEGNALVASDERPTTDKPSDVYVDVPDIVEVATISASGEATTILVDKGPRTYSECALTKGLSQCIRYETLWPRAMAGFNRNPLLGSGYATLTKEEVVQFTEAESTDNNFLRTLGETGALGFVTFYGVIILALWSIRNYLFSQDFWARTLSISLLTATVGLLINAVYIDVFAASKVALTYWALVGLVLGYLNVIKPE